MFNFESFTFPIVRPEKNSRMRDDSDCGCCACGCSTNSVLGAGVGMTTCAHVGVTDMADNAVCKPVREITLAASVLGWVGGA